jgi:hypothetical protein
MSTLSLFDKAAFLTLFSVTFINFGYAACSPDIPTDLSSDVRPKVRLAPGVLSKVTNTPNKTTGSK